MARVIILDANVLIALVDPDDAHHLRAESFVRDHLAKRLGTSVLTLAEALVRPVAAGRSEITQRRFERFGLEVVGLAGSAAVELAEIRAMTRLRMPDAIVVLTAEMMGAEIATADGVVTQASRARGLIVHELDR